MTPEFVVEGKMRKNYLRKRDDLSRRLEMVV